MTIDTLRQMIKSNACVETTDIYSQLSVHLKEPQQSDSTVEIKGLPDEVIVIKVDTFPAPDSIFTGINGECRRADYVIIANEQDRKRILFIEMKRTKAPQNQIVEQFKGAACFIAYCKEVAKQFYNCSDLLSGYEFRYVSFGHTSIAKRKTRVERTAVQHNRPDRMMKIDWPNNLYFKHIAG
jgi:hypothetical protein